MSAKRRPGAAGSSRRERLEAQTARGAKSVPDKTAATASATALADGRVRFALIIVALILAAIVVLGADYVFSTVFGTGAGGGAAPSPTATAPAGAATPTQFGQGVNGRWSSVTTYTNVWNLDGGMNAWTASGRTLIQKSR